jgi:hypothetical protein
MRFAYRGARLWALAAWVCGAVALAAGGAGCGKGTACAGGERCNCYPNGTCNAGLTCFSNVCVNVGDAAADGPSSAGSGGSGPGSGGMGSGGQSGAGTGGIVGTGGVTAVGTGGGTAPGTGGSGGPTDGGTAGDAICRLFEVRAESTVPTVFLLVDRSGSMFETLVSGTCSEPPCSAWSVLKAGALKVVKDLEGVVRFGFGAFTGQAPNMCPIFDRVGAALNNHDAIAAAYNALGEPAFKAETPTVLVLQALRNDILGPDPATGPKYILFVTDGEPDYCNDAGFICPVDSTVRELQVLKAQGITTLVFGVASSLSGIISEQSLSAFANAGGGQPVAPALPTGFTIDDIYPMCSGMPPWMSAWTAAGRTGGMPLGDYGSSGNAPVYRPDPTNQQALTDLLATTISGVKSCTFDLANGLTVDLGQLDRVSVAVQGQDVPRDATNGWTMASATRLVLSGTACALWRSPTTRTIDFRFPCGVIQGS